MGKLTNLNPTVPIADFESPAISPINLIANQWQEIGPAFQFGELGKGTLWDILVYFQYIDTSGISLQYYQYCGGGTLAAIYWQADFQTNEGILISSFEAHNEPDFTARIRFGRGNQLRKVEIKPDRAINIVAPGFLKVSGVRRI